MSAAERIEAARDEVLQPLLDAVERFCRAEVRSAQIDAQHHIPPGVLDGLGQLGLFGVTLPEAHGGAGLGLPEACRVVTHLARHDRSVATTVGLHLGLGTRGLVAYGSPALQQAYLPSLASGQAIGAFSTTEPQAGSDLSRLSTVARPDGEHLVIDGRKLYVTNGGLARVFTLTVSTPGLGGAQRGTSLVLFERSDRGFIVGREEHKLGLRGSSTTPLTLEEVRVPASRVIGAPGRGTEQLHHVLAWGRTLMSAGCCGTARSALALAREHTATRHQFGKPLAQQPVVREQLAAMVARAFAMEAVVSQTALAHDDLPALLHRSMVAKVLCSEGASFVVDTALQLHGGGGFIEDTGLALLARDVRITRIFEGANDVLLSQLGATLATSPRQRAPLRGQVGPMHEALARHADALAERLFAAREAQSARYRIALLQKGRLLHRLGRALVWSSALDAAVLAAAAQGVGALGPAELFASLAADEVAAALNEPIADEVIGRTLEQVEVPV